MYVISFLCKKKYISLDVTFTYITTLLIHLTGPGETKTCMDIGKYVIDMGYYHFVMLEIAEIVHLQLHQGSFFTSYY